MSMSLTLRRADPKVIDALPEHETTAFLLNQPPHEALDPTEVIEFFAPWHIVHFMSSGTAWDRSLPAGFVLGGSPWGQHHPDEEPATLLSSRAVAEAAAHLAGLSEAVIDQRLQVLTDPQSGIYGGPVPAEAFPLAKKAHQMIADFIAAATRNGQAIVKAVI